MYLAISALAMGTTALLSNRLGNRFLSYMALFMGIIASVSLCVLIAIGIGRELF